jgi:fucose permease
MSYRLSVFIAACTGMLLFGACLITMGAVIPDVRVRFSLNEMDAGTLFSLLPFGILTGSLLFGPLADLYGYKYVLSFSCFLLGIGFEGLAFAPRASFLKFFILIFGMSGGAINGAANAAVADTSSNDKRSGLSLLGVFFAVGALGMPFLLGVLRSQFEYTTVLSATGIVAFMAAVYMLLVRFPAPKQQKGFPIAQSLSFIKDPALLVMGFFLLCLSSFEGVINNWISTYLIQQHSFTEENALYSLSLFMTGMALMRLLVGSIGKKLSLQQLLGLSFFLLMTGILLLWKAEGFLPSVAGVVLLGLGLAPGFPLTLGLVGNRYPDISATAFSFVLTISLTGNMVVNFSMGVIAKFHGISHIITLMGVVWLIMLVLGVRILRQLRTVIS